MLSCRKPKSRGLIHCQVAKLSASAPELPTDQPHIDPSEMQDGSNDIHDPLSSPVGHIYPTLPTDMSHTMEEERGGERDKAEEAGSPAGHQKKKVTIMSSPVDPSSSAAEIQTSSSSSLSANTAAFVTAAETPENLEVQCGKGEFKTPTSSSSSSSSLPTVPVNYAIQHISESKELDSHHPPAGGGLQGKSQLGRKRKVVGPLSSPTAVKRSRLPLTQDTGSGILGQQPPLLPQPTSHGHPLLSSTPPQQSPSWISQLFKRKPTPK